MGSQRSWRWRAARGAGAAAAVLLALLVLVTAVPALRTGAESWLGTLVPTPTATLVPGSDRFYFSASVSWTTVSLDGHSVTPPRIGRDPPLALPRGLHQLEWRADPFLPQHCHLAVPYSVRDTCSRPLYFSNRPAQPPVNLVLLDESLATLPPAQQNAVVDGLKAALSGFSDIVRPGETYVFDNYPTYGAVATEPLRATLRFALDVAIPLAPSAGNTSCQLSDVCQLTDCSQLCTLGGLALQSAGVTVEGRTWYVVAFAHLGWNIATLSGQSLATDLPISWGGLAVAEFPLLFALSWDGSAWHAQPLVGLSAGAILRSFNAAISTIAASGSSMLVEPGCAAMPDYIGPNTAISGYAAVRFISAPNPAQGCLAVVTPAPNAPAAWYLYRFGVLLAANDVARQTSPRLPQADAYERALAAQLAASSG